MESHSLSLLRAYISKIDFKYNFHRFIYVNFYGVLFMTLLYVKNKLPEINNDNGVRMHNVPLFP